MPTLTGSQIWKPSFWELWEALQIEAAVPQLCTFHVNLHSPTRNPNG